jgi:hypothetical protein
MNLYFFEYINVYVCIFMCNTYTCMLQIHFFLHLFFILFLEIQFQNLENQSWNFFNFYLSAQYMFIYIYIFIYMADIHKLWCLYMYTEKFNSKPRKKKSELETAYEPVERYPT